MLRSLDPKTEVMRPMKSGLVAIGAFAERMARRYWVHWAVILTAAIVYGGLLLWGPPNTPSTAGNNYVCSTQP